jgi:allophanate hydrolase
MNGALEVISPGLHTSVQDLGRLGWQRMGVPVSGALDTESLRLANALVGNSPETAALEIFHHGPTLAVKAESIRVALAGGGLIEVLGDYRRTIPAWRSVRLHRDDVFEVGALQGTACCYLAVEGGLAISPCLGSRSTYARGSLGGFVGRALREGDLVPLVLAEAGGRADLELPRPPSPRRDQAIRVVLGPQEDRFTAKSVAAFLAAEYTVSTSADRMGMRLEGPSLKHKGKRYDIVSDAIVTGAIQVPGNGQPIVLLADHQTTGGYPKIATVISADLPAVGRRLPGDTIRFVAVDVDQAEQTRRAQETVLHDLFRTIKAVSAGKEVDLRSLYRLNLISGVVSAQE